MKHLIFLLISMFLFAACRPQPPQVQEELAQAQARVQSLEAALAQRQAKGQLVHIVFLNLKDEITEEETSSLIAELNKLKALQGVHQLEIGKIAETGDERLISAYELAFQMSFASMADYERYQNHSTHLQVKEALRAYLGGPPAAYDYWRE